MNMDSGPQQAAMQGHGIGTPSGPDAPTGRNSMSPTAGPFTQTTSQIPFETFVPNFNLQDSFMHTYGGAFSGADSTVSDTSSSDPGYRNVLVGSNGNNANATMFFDGNIPASSYGMVGHQWSNLPFPAPGAPIVAAMPQNAFYYSGVTQALPLTQAQPSTTPFVPTAVPRAASGIQQPPGQSAMVSHMHPQVATGAPAANSGVSLRQTRHFVPYPQSGVSSGTLHQRRHSRVNSMTSAPQSTSGQQQAHASVQPTGARTISPATADANVLPPQPSLSQPQRSQATPVTTGNTSTTVRAAQHRNQQILQQQRALINRRTQMRLLQNMRGTDARALQMYEQGLLHDSRHSSVINARTSSPPAKRLDAPREECPEPKDTSELTVNLECKICMSQLVDTVLLPCGHAILCRWCADQHIPSIHGHPKGKATCPMCRENVRLKHRIFFP